jgi:hypothetical protein
MIFALGYAPIVNLFGPMVEIRLKLASIISVCVVKELSAIQNGEFGVNEVLPLKRKFQ